MKRLAISTTFLALLLMAFTASAAAAPAEPLWKTCFTGAEAGQCAFPAGVAAQPGSGNVFVVNKGNNRIEKFSPWGEFLMAWGWGVRDGSPEFQRCGPEATPPSSTCQEGVGGGGPGQIDSNSAKGIAAATDGAIYVHESSTAFNEPSNKYLGNNRIQKLDSDGTFIWAIGRQVNLTKVQEREQQEANAEPVTVTVAEENRCTAASGDVCGGGVRGSGAGEFGIGPESNYDLEAFSPTVAVAPSGDIYAGGYERIQRFSPAGDFIGSTPVPGKLVASLGVDSVGSIYVAFTGNTLGSLPQKNVVKLDAAGTTICTVGVNEPRALTLGGDGSLYVLDGHRDGLIRAVVRKYSTGCTEDPAFAFPTEQEANQAFEPREGIAASTACNVDGVDIFLTNPFITAETSNFVQAFGPQPDPTVCPPPPAAPTISAQWVNSVDTSSASVAAEINPHFWPETTYYVEYGTGKCADGGCDLLRPLPPGAPLGSNSDFAVATKGVLLQSLQPGTTYHYRFVAQSPGGGPVKGVGGEVGADGEEGSFRTFAPASPPQTSCPNQAFRTGASANLPGCRAYEMVSPVDKNGGDIGTALYTSLGLASADGGRVTFASLRAFADPEAAPLQNQFLATRTAGGWATRSISPPRKLPGLYGPGGATQFKFFSEDLCQAWFVQETDLALVPDAPAEVPNLYSRANCAAEPGYELLSPVTPTGGFQGEQESNYYVDLMGLSADGSHAVYRADAPLTANACKTERIFQTYIVSPDAPMRLVSSLPGNKANCTHSGVGTPTHPTYDARLSQVYHAVSDDGETVYWSAGINADPVVLGGSGTVQSPELYVRVNATQPQSPLSSGQCTDPTRACTYPVSGATSSAFIAARPSGDAAVYRVGPKLYAYDLTDKESTVIAEGVTSVVGTSEDLSRVYFFSNLPLSGEQENSSGDKAQAGKANLYLYEEGEGMTFIGILTPKEASGIGFGGELNPVPSSPGDTRPNRRTSRVTPDGLHLAFTSIEPLTGYDNTVLRSGQPATEIFVYDAAPGGGAGVLACVSCNPSGARPQADKVGDDNDESLNWAAGRLPGWPDQFHPSRLLSADGNRLFFDSFDALVTSDSNGSGDVYEWRRAADAGACEAVGAQTYVESAGGCLSLISSGRSAEDSEVIDASESGSDVFFATGAGLLSQDPGLVDVYDARVNGGFPLPAMPPAPCEGEACQGPIAIPTDPTPASSTFHGAGNVKEKVAKKKKHRKKRHHRKKKKSSKASKRADHQRRASR